MSKNRKVSFTEIDNRKKPKSRRPKPRCNTPPISTSAKLIKLADKISNLRDVANDPPANWNLERKLEYFDWAKQVIDQLRGVHSGLEELFDKAYSMRPNEGNQEGIQNEP